MGRGVGKRLNSKGRLTRHEADAAIAAVVSRRDSVLRNAFEWKVRYMGRGAAYASRWPAREHRTKSREQL